MRVDFFSYHWSKPVFSLVCVLITCFNNVLISLNVANWLKTYALIFCKLVNYSNNSSVDIDKLTLIFYP